MFIFFKIYIEKLMFKMLRIIFLLSILNNILCNNNLDDNLDESIKNLTIDNNFLFQPANLNNNLNQPNNFYNNVTSSSSKNIVIFYNNISTNITYSFSSSNLIIPIMFSSQKGFYNNFIYNPNGSITVINGGLYKARYGIIYQNQSLSSPLWLGIALFDSTSGFPLSLIKQFYCGYSNISSPYSEVYDEHFIQLNSGQIIQLNLISTSSFSFSLSNQVMSGGYNALLSFELL